MANVIWVVVAVAIVISMTAAFIANSIIYLTSIYSISPP